MSGRHLAFPFRIAPDGRTATPASLDDHIKGEIIQLLLTAPGGDAVPRYHQVEVLPIHDDTIVVLVVVVMKDVTGERRKAEEIQALNDYGTESLAALLLAVERIRCLVRAGDEPGFAALMERCRAYVQDRQEQSLSRKNLP